MLMLSQRGMMSKAGGAPPPPPGWSPATLSSTVFWVAPDGGKSLIADGGVDRVFQWDDESDGSNHLTQAVVANRPFWLANEFSGFGVADFRAGQWLISADFCNVHWPLASGRTIECFVVFRPDVLVSGSHLLNINQQTTTHAFQLRWNASNFEVAYRNSANSLTTSGMTRSITGLAATWHWVRVQRTSPVGGPGTVTGWFDGVQFGHVTDAREFVLAGGGSVPVVLGGREDAANCMDGAIAEAWVGNAPLGAADETDLTAYIASRYGL